MAQENEHATDGKQEIPEGIERRILAPELIDMRVDEGETPRLVGYAAKYGRFTDMGWFREKIRAGAFADALADPDADVRCLKNHDPNLILGRSKSGTLKLESNTVGLRFEDEVPETTTGKDTLEEVRRGDISGCSFSFTVAEQNWKNFEDDTPPERTIIKVARLFDVGPVTYPAYPDTSVAARSLEAFKAQETQGDGQRTERSDKPGTSDGFGAPEGEANEISAERKREIARGYRKAGRIITRNRPAEV